NMENMDAELRSFYTYNSLHMEPWDGPAGVVLTDGRYAVCVLDSNGLRPSRWVMTKNGYLTCASEIGVHDYSPADVIAKGKLGPGQILVIDTQEGHIFDSRAVADYLKVRQPYARWIARNTTWLESRLAEEVPELQPL